MSEKLQSNIDRYDRKIVVQLGQKALVFSYLNTRLYEYPEQYSQFNHAYRKNDGADTGTYYLESESPELYKQLDENNYPKSVMPYPSLADEETIMKHYDNILHKGLDELLESNDE